MEIGSHSAAGERKKMICHNFLVQHPDQQRLAQFLQPIRRASSAGRQRVCYGQFESAMEETHLAFRKRQTSQYISALAVSSLDGYSTDNLLYVDQPKSLPIYDTTPEQEMYV
jgi:hypothetical protein